MVPMFYMYSRLKYYSFPNWNSSFQKLPLVISKVGIHSSVSYLTKISHPKIIFKNQNLMVLFVFPIKELQNTCYFHWNYITTTHKHSFKDSFYCDKMYLLIVRNLFQSKFSFLRKSPNQVNDLCDVFNSGLIYNNVLSLINAPGALAQKGGAFIKKTDVHS